MKRAGARRQRGGVVMFALGWLLLFAVAVYFFAYVLRERENPNRLSVLAAQGGGELTLRRAADGHYYAEGWLNGAPVTFLLDTGATQIAVPAHIAAAAGLRQGEARRVRTAAGVSTAYMTVIEKLQIGSLRFTDLRGVIIDAGPDTDIVLLGMNALGRLQITLQDDELIMRPPADS